MKLKDLTREQATEIAKLCYDFDDGIKSDFKFHYQPYDASWYEDAREFISVIFDGIIFADKIYKIKLEIQPNLDCHLFYLNFDKTINLDVYNLIGCNNQNKIQRKFIEWGIEPDYTKN